jgi:flagella basal body P-ring formation protein FlgA
MAQTVSQERPLSWRDIALRPLVRKGQLVDVVVAEGGMNISMKGISLGNGGAGEMVSVRNLDSRKEFSAKVINLNTVQVKF